MLISRRRRFLFVHIQKTGGSSVRRALQAAIPDAAPFLAAHDTAAEARARLGHELYSTYYTAAFVRNPWDRLVSWYTMIVERGARRTWWQKLLDRHEYRLWQYVHENSSTFAEFVQRCTDEIVDRGSRKSFCRNQIDYLADEDGRIIVDFVGRFESLASDVGRLFDRLQLPVPRLPHLNPSTRVHYSAYYSDDLADVVRERFARDIEAFGYEFARPRVSADGAASPRPV